jgi:hypothetical protein
MPPDAKGIRAELRARVIKRGLRWRPAIWRDLVNSKNVKWVVEGRASVEDLIAVYLRKEETYYARPVPQHEVVRIVEDEHARARALAELCARQLDSYCGVEDFRVRAGLAGKLLGKDAVTEWVLGQARGEGPVAERYVMVPEPADDHLRWSWTLDNESYVGWLIRLADRVADDAAAELPAMKLHEASVLQFALTERGPRHLQIRGDGLLARLKEVVSGEQGLCVFTGWSEHAAVTYVLSGQLPAYRNATVSVWRGLYPAAAQIELVLSANMTDKQVGELYHEVRSELRGAFERGMNEKHLAFALFIDELRDSGLGWKELHRRWNVRHPDWAYETEKDPHSRRFSLEARRTWSRLTGETWRDLREPRPWLRSEGQQKAR